MEEAIVVEDAGPVRRITLNRPAKKNALTAAMYGVFNRALSDAAGDDRISVVALGATGDAFTSGNDVADFLRASTGEAGPGAGSVGLLLHTLASFPKPLVASVNGAAIGIGATMLLHCDLVIASTEAFFQFPFTQLAIVPEAASSVLLPARVGLQRASEWLLLGERIDAQTALRSGLVNAVVAPAELAGATSARVEALLKLPIGALRETKRLIREPLRAEIDRAMARELEAFATRLTTPEAAAAFTAFLTRNR